MSEYIEKDFVIKRIHETMDMQDLYLPQHFIQILNEPPVYELIKNEEDLVEVVRCEYCIFSRPDEYGLECMVHYRPTKEDDFCSYGEKVKE